MKPIFLGLSIVATFVSFVPFAAAAETEAPTRAVSYGDLDLESEAGAKVLYSRIRSAASSVCGDHTAERDVGRARFMKDCTESAVEEAVAKVDSDVLKSLHDADYRVTVASRKDARKSR